MTVSASSTASASGPAAPVRLETAPADLHFALNAEDVRETTDRIIKISIKTLDAVALVAPEDCDFDSVILRLARLENMVTTAAMKVSMVLYFNPDKEAREASEAATKKLEEYDIEASMREDVYHAVKRAADRLPTTGLTDEDRRLVTRLLQQYERNGLALPEAKRNELKTLKKRMSELAINFSRNQAEEKSFIAFTREELVGMPEDYLESLTKLEDGTFKVTMQYPDRIPLMRKAKNPETRRRVDEQSTHMCPENVALLQEMIELRAQAAALLGYENHAAYVLELKMAKNPKTVLDFLGDLKTKLAVVGAREKAKLVELKAAERKELGLPEESELYSWDMSYYHTLMVQKEFQVDQDEVKQYFSFEVVTKAMFALYQKLFGVVFTQTKDVATWHEDVTVYHVHDTSDGKYLGTFFLDLFPREGAYGHAAVFPLRPTCVLADGTYQTPVAAMKCNFTKPTATAPSLFKHDEIVTYFHEFGHAVHVQLSKTKHARFHGPANAGDFVEAPSQMLENFVWEKSILKDMSSHYKTGEQIPDALVERLVASQHVNDGLMNLRQLFFGTYDMRVHSVTADGAKAIDTSALWNSLREEVTLLPGANDGHGQSSFGHIMGGYDVGYYGYLYSKVFAQDMYSRFQNEGLESLSVGLDYRRHILLPGGSIDELDLLRNFLGREPNSDAFLKSLGL